MATVVAGLGYLYMGVKACLTRYKPLQDDESERYRGRLSNNKFNYQLRLFIRSLESNQTSTSLGCIIFLILMNCFNFVYMGAEFSYGLFLTTFMVKSSLHSTKTEGAFLSAIFWGTFATIR